MPRLSHTQAAEEAVAKLRNRFPGIDITSFRSDNILTIPREKLTDVMRYARDACGFDMLLNVSGVDRLGEEPRYEVNYIISQSESGANLMVRTLVPENDASVPSMVSLWRSADWPEREQYDLLGIQFTDHPDLRRILMWDDYPYHPLRKDFPVSGIPVTTPGVAVTEKAPTLGGPFVTSPGGRTAADREPRARG